MTNESQRSLSLAGQVAVVTGSTKGIGAGIARKFAEQGAKVVVHGRSRTDGEEMVASLRDLGGDALLILADLLDETQCRSLIRATVERFGQLDILVNNAGILDRGNIESTTVTLWDRVFSINLRAPFILCQEAVKYMKQRQTGCIINIGSVAGYVGLRKLLPYATSKGALTTFTKNLANFLTSYRIRVNQINPGWVLTEGERRIQTVGNAVGETWLEEALHTRPFGRLLLPEDIARASIFFATSELITGAILDYEQVVIGAPIEL